MFILHDQLAKDCIEVGDFELCKLLLLNDSQYPWLILVPKIAEVTEIFQLSESDQLLLLKESNAVAQTISDLFKADKINQAAIGNMVSQLHIHCIARFKVDVAWPKPVWGVKKSVPYSQNDLNNRLSLLRSAFSPFGLK
jgi:diadenosine tetraphosphate (Ap4A) HIT family hydrolase